MKWRLLRLSSRDSLLRLGIAVAVSVLACGLLFARLPRLTMWSDEYHSFRVSSLPLSRILAGDYAGDLQPPLYAALLHVERLVFGDSEIAARGLSLFFAILSLPLLFKLAHCILRDFIPSVAAMALMAFHPLFISYSLEIRPYSLLVLSAILGFLSCLMIHGESRRPRAWAVALTLGTVTALYAHHFGIVVPASIVVFTVASALWCRRWSVRYTLTLLSTAVALIMYLPGLLVLRGQALSYPRGAGFASSLPQSLQLFLYSTDHPAYEPILAALAMLALALGAWVLVTQIKNTPAVLLPACGIGAAIAVAVAARIAGISVLSRYLIAALPLVAIGMAATLAAKGRKWTGLVHIIGVAGVCLYAGYGLHFVLNTDMENQQAFWKKDWKRFSVVVRDLRAKNEPIAIMSWDATPLQYYLQTAAVTSSDLERQIPLGAASSYLIVMTPNSVRPPILESAIELFEDKTVGVSVLRLRTGSGPTRPTP